MNPPPTTKQHVLQSHQIVLYSRALHPELFALKARKVVRHGEYELEAWLMPAQHLLRFEHKTLCVSELLTDQEKGVPQQGIVTAFLCAGEREVEHKFARDTVTYMATIQTETLGESLYQATYEEMLDHARRGDCLAHRWTDEAGKCLSVIDIQRMTREIHAQTYHMIAAHGLVLRTQTIFEIK